MSINESLKLGYAQLQQGNFEQAKSAFSAVLATDANNQHALNLMGVLHIRQGQYDAAIKFLKKAIANNERDHQAYTNIGLAYKDAEQLDSAIDAFRSSLAIAGDNPATLNNLAAALRDNGEPGEAIKVLDKALALAANYPDAWSNLSGCLRDTGQHQDAGVAADRALKLAPNMPHALHNKAEVLRYFTRYDEAIEYFKKAIEQDSDFIDCMVGLANVLRENEQPQQAESWLARAIKTDPESSEAIISMGVLKEQQGDLENAEKCFKQAIGVDGSNVMAHYQLAQMKGRKVASSEFEAMQQLWQQNDVPQFERSYLGLALFRGAEQQGNYDNAFNYLSEANAITATYNHYDQHKAQRYVDDLVSYFDKMTTTADMVDIDQSLLFIVGMPRSGTTLTEQVLAEHDQMVGMGEVSYAYDMARDVEQLTGKTFPQGCDELSVQQLKELGQRYLARCPQAKGKTLIDKSPLNYQYVGLLSKVFKNARFINCERDPIDTCFSIYKLPFEGSQSYAHDLSALATHYKKYQQLMAQWSTRVGARLITSSYEQTVSDLEASARSLLNFAELDFDERVLAFHESKRLVRTPSASQVRQPIYKDSVAAYKRYESHLKPLIDGLKG